MSETFGSEARVEIPTPRRYLGQLCKHFEHRCPVTLEAARGRIEFPVGVCDVAAVDDATLVLRASAPSSPDLASLEDVVGRHLTRFAFREAIDIVWIRDVAEGPQYDVG